MGIALGVFSSWITLLLLILVIYVSSILLMMGIVITGKIEGLAEALNTPTVNIIDLTLGIIKMFTGALIIAVSLFIIYKKIPEFIKKGDPFSEEE